MNICSFECTRVVVPIILRYMTMRIVCSRLSTVYCTIVQLCIIHFIVLTLYALETER